MASERSWKLLEILEETSRFFAARKLADARLQAELLLAAVLGVKRLDLYLQFDRLLDADEVNLYRDYVRQRLKRTPFQYIVGEAAFRYLELKVTADVLIPRPETEVLVDVALDKASAIEAPRCLDLCCGSGAIALALAHECLEAVLVATDISPRALAVAKDNGERCGLDGRVEWLCSDLFNSLENKTFDLIVSNPPYVRHADIDLLEPEVRDYEPHLALDGGADGLDCYRRIATEAARFLVPGGHLLFEVGDDQAEAVSELVRQSGLYKGVEVVADLNDIPRIVVTCTPS
ncbi:MAG: release factor glutamine methyltransferase [Candidatus Latescibacterota bacterium]|jgi:release factor glutamine methyltransferase